MEWISFKDKQPEYQQSIIVYNISGNIQQIYYLKEWSGTFNFWIPTPTLSQKETIYDKREETLRELVESSFRRPQETQAKIIKYLLELNTADRK